VIAIALCVIAARGILGPAVAQGAVCGESPDAPCFVSGSVQVDDVRGIVHVTGLVDIGGAVRIDTGLNGLPVQIKR
jgi:hypothetical protein